MALLRRVVEDFIRHKAPRLAGALAFYTLFSLAPLLVLLTGLLGHLLGGPAVRVQIHDQLTTAWGAEAAATAEQLVEAMRRPGHRGSGLLAGLLLLYAGTSLFAALQDALNTVWDVRPRPGLGVRNVLRVRALSFAMVLAAGVVLLVSVVGSTLLQSLRDEVSLPHAARTWRALDSGLSLALFAALFTLVFAVLPDVRVRFRHVWAGALGTSVLFWAGHRAVAAYVAHSHVASLHGAIGSLVAFLLWVYWSWQILLLGAEATQVVARRGGDVTPSAHAEPIPR